jgi:hypothetical protein
MSTNLVKTVREGLQTTKLTSSLVAGVEDIDTLEVGVEQLLPVDSKYSDVQIKAGMEAIKVSANPGAAFEAYANSIEAGADNGIAFDPIARTAPGEVDFGVEAFADTNVDNVATRNFVFNVEASKQSPYAEGFFPTVVYPAGTGHVKLNIDQAFFTKTKLNNTGSVRGRELISVIRSAFEKDSVFTKNTTRLWPVADANAEFKSKFFVDGLDRQVVDDNSGDLVTTAPLKTGVVIPLKDVSQTANQLANGTLSTDDQLSGDIGIVNLVADIDGEKVKISLEGYSDARATDTPAGNRNEDIQLSFKRDSFVIVPKSLVRADNGQPVSKFENLPAGYGVEYSLDISGNGNVIEGTFALYANRWEVVNILDAAGQIVPPTHPDYAGYLADAQKINRDAIVGFEPEVFLTNSALRRDGLVVTLQEESYNFNIRPENPLTVKVAIGDLAGKDSDAKVIPQLVKLSGIQNAKRAITIIEKIIGYFKTQKNQGIDISRAKFGGLSGVITNNYFEELTIDLATEINSFDDATRADAIKGKLTNAIRALVGDMIAKTGYKEVIRGIRQEIGVVVGTHVTIANYLGKELDLGDGIVAKVVSEAYEELEGKIRIAFTNWGANRHDAVDPTIFGNFIYTPALVADYTGVDSDGGKKRFYKVLPHTLFITGITAIGSIEVKNLKNSY